MPSYKKILDEYHKERNTKAFYKTKGFKVLWNAFVELTKRESFIIEIRVLRTKHAIPPQGFDLPIGESPYPPKEWRYAKNVGTKLKQLSKVQKELEILCTKHHFLPADWVPTFEQFLFYNRPLITPTPSAHNLCFVSETETNPYPITLNISPLASKNVILDYVEKLYSTEIKPLQKKYTIGTEIVGKVRTKDKKLMKIHDFLYENRDWAYDELQLVVYKKFHHHLDTGEIGAIISKEKAKRNK